LTTQEIPPNQVVIGLSLFLTLFVMGPTFEQISQEAVIPFLNKTVSSSDAVRLVRKHMHRFLLAQTRVNDIALFAELAGYSQLESPEQTPMRVMIPAFMISELKTAFIMGFCIYIPFLVIDLVVSSVLMSLGMMMMSPMIMSLPFKVLLFVLADGWRLVIQSLSGSFS
jgi:flagellar biosynthetic protein FliP